MQNLNRREFGLLSALALSSTTLSREASAAESEQLFKLQYTLPSCMYGYESLADILPEARKIGASGIDIWPKPHGDQREQLDALGEETFRTLLTEHDVTLDCITQYKLGPFGLTEELDLAKRLGCGLIVTGGKGPRGLTGNDLKAAVKKFVEQMKPLVAKAEETGVSISIENHANNLIESPDSLKWLAEFRPSSALSIAFAPYHLPQDSNFLAQLIRDLGDSITMFYAWEHGAGCMEKLPKSEELLQMPSRGPLDFQPLLQALKDIQYSGQTEVFMHPVPRGIPILPTVDQTTAEINRSRVYLNGICKELS